jgi:hypothetical protein
VLGIIPSDGHNLPCRSASNEVARCGLLSFRPCRTKEAAAIARIGDEGGDGSGKPTGRKLPSAVRLQPIAENMW